MPTLTMYTLTKKNLMDLVFQAGLVHVIEFPVGSIFAQPDHGSMRGLSAYSRGEILTVCCVGVSNASWSHNLNADALQHFGVIAFQKQMRFIFESVNIASHFSFPQSPIVTCIITVPIQTNELPALT